MTVKKLIEGQNVIQKFKNKNSGVNIKAEGKRHTPVQLSGVQNIVRNMVNIDHLLLPPERTIRNKFLTAVKGCHICNDKERAPISLPTRYVGLAIPYLMKHRKLNLWFASKSHQNLEHQFKKFTIQFNCR